jgi:hypothetical protein
MSDLVSWKKPFLFSQSVEPLSRVTRCEQPIFASLAPILRSTP